MKVNFVLPPIGSSGGIDVIYKYVDLLQKSGYDVCVYKAILANNMQERRIVLSGKYVIKLSVMRM